MSNDRQSWRVEAPQAMLGSGCLPTGATGSVNFAHVVREHCAYGRKRGREAIALLVPGRPAFGWLID